MSETLVHSEEVPAYGHAVDPVYGLVAEFADTGQLLAAAQRTYDAGYRKIDAYSPLPVEGLAEALGHRDVKVPWIMFGFGLFGCIGGFLFLVWCVGVDYPFNIAGRPVFSWPMFIPITFELTVLFAAFSGVFGMFILNGLPQPYHPVFDAHNFHEASDFRVFLSVEAEDPKFDVEETRQFLEGLGAVHVSAVALRK